MPLSYHTAVAEKKSKRALLPKGARRRRKTVGTSLGLAAVELQAAAPTGAVAELHQLIETEGGKVFCGLCRRCHRWVIASYAMTLPRLWPTTTMR